MALADAILIDCCKAIPQGKSECDLRLVYHEGTLRKETRRRYPDCRRIDYRKAEMVETALCSLTAAYGLRLSAKAIRDLEYEVERDEKADSVAYMFRLEKQRLWNQSPDWPQSNMRLSSSYATRNFALSIATPSSKAKALNALAAGKGKLVLQRKQQPKYRKGGNVSHIDKLGAQLTPPADEVDGRIPRKETAFAQVLAQLPPLPSTKKAKRYAPKHLKSTGKTKGRSERPRFYRSAVDHCFYKLPTLPDGKVQINRTPESTDITGAIAPPRTSKSQGRDRYGHLDTALRELSTLAGWWLASLGCCEEYQGDFLTPGGYLALLNQAGVTCQRDTLGKVKADLAMRCTFSARQSDIIRHNIAGGRRLYEHIPSPKDKNLEWTGDDTQSDLPDDIRIGQNAISLKNWSHILENTGLSDIMSYLTGKSKEKCGGRGADAFLVYAHDEYDEMYQVLLDQIPSYLDEPAGVFDPCNGDGKPLGTRMFRDEDGNIMLERRNTKGKIVESERLPETVDGLFKQTTAQLRKTIISPIIRDIKNRADYVAAKQQLIKKAGKAICEHVLRQTPQQEGLARFVNCREESYDYAYLDKDGSMLFTEVPAIRNCKELQLVSIEPGPSKKQLTIQTTIGIAGTDQTVTLLTEIRYSHGPFCGVPECKHQCLSAEELVAFYQALAA